MNLDEHESFIRDLARTPGLATFFENVNNEMTSKMVGKLFTGFLQKPTEEGRNEPMDLDFLLRVLREMKADVEGSLNSPPRGVHSFQRAAGGKKQTRATCGQRERNISSFL